MKSATHGILSRFALSLALSLILQNGVLMAESADTALSSESSGEGILSRWFELEEALLGARIKVSENSDGVPSAPVHYRTQYRGRLKFDREGRYALTANVTSGNNFPSPWNNTGVGMSNATSNLYLRHLFFSAAPLKSVEVQFGGLEFVRGELSDIITYSRNGFMVGERVAVRKPDKLFFDEISATGAYIGDLDRPGIEHRIHNLGHMNYHQFLLTKRVSERVSLSADYTSHWGASTLRQAARIYFKPGRLPEDMLLLESYQRIDGSPAAGYNIQIQKALAKRLVLTVGVSDVDKDYGTWNSERLGKGRRAYVIAEYTLLPELTIVFGVTHAFFTDFYLSNRKRVDLGITYDLTKALKKTHLF